MTTLLNNVNKLFYKLFEKGSLSFKDEPELYKVYRDIEAQPYIQSFENSFNCRIINTNSETLFLVPTLENTLFSLQEQDMKKICRVQSPTRIDAYLSYYIALITLNELYTPYQFEQDLSVDFVTTEGLSQLVTARLLAAKENVTDESFITLNEKSEDPLIYEMENIERIYHTWDAKHTEGAKSQKYQSTYVNNILTFLEKQELVELDKMINGYKAFATERLQAVMTHIVYGEHEHLLARLLGAVDWTKQPEFKQETIEYKLFQDDDSVFSIDDSLKEEN